MKLTKMEKWPQKVLLEKHANQDEKDRRETSFYQMGAAQNAASQLCKRCHSSKAMKGLDSCVRCAQDPVRPWRKRRGPRCEWCLFEPLVASQLDLDHLDGNHENDVESNHQTLCANCHRLKTWWERQLTPQDRLYFGFA